MEAQKQLRQGKKKNERETWLKKKGRTLGGNRKWMSQGRKGDELRMNKKENGEIKTKGSNLNGLPWGRKRDKKKEVRN